MNRKMEKILNILAEVKGATFIGLDTETPVKLLGGKKNPLQGRVTKLTLGANVMISTDETTNSYENAVKKNLEKEGKDPADFQLSERKWGKRIPGTPFVTNDDETKLYLQVRFLKSGHTEYLLDGQLIDAEKIEGLPPYRGESKQGGLSDENKIILRTYDINSIRAITINKQRFEL